VRQDQRCPEFVITSWQVERLSGKGLINPDGLFQFDGTGFDPARPEKECAWSVILKNMRAPEEEGDISSIWYWKREVLAVQAGLLSDLPKGGLKAPRFYGTVEQDGGAWIWMEYVKDGQPPRWPLSRFPAAARSLGRMHGAYLGGRPLPDYPWLSRDQGITWAGDVDPTNFLEHPRVQMLLSVENRARMQRIYANRERFFKAYRALPQVFGHCDLNRRNLFFRMNAEGVEEIVGIDWAWVGIAPIGWELLMLLANNALLFEMEPEELPGVEEAAISAYLDTLRSAGWQADSRLVRLGYCVSATLFPLLGLPFYAASDWMGTDPNLLQTGCGFEEAAPGWRELVEHLLDLGEEALGLMDELPLGTAVL
jgi:hypothetical protein